MEWNSFGSTGTFRACSPAERRKKIGFKDDKPGKDWVSSFLRRHQDLTMKRRVALENVRVEAMRPKIVAKHFARVKSLVAKHNIDSTRLFNLDECGFSMRGMTFGRSKCIVEKKSRANTREPKFKCNVDHVTVMPIVSAAGQSLTPLVVLPDKEARWRKRSGKLETPAKFLSKSTHLFYRQPAGVDTNIFETWATLFVKETEQLRSGGKKLLLVMDGYACHISYKTLSLFSSNGIVVAGLPAHTTHALKPLDVGVFSPLKEEFRRLLGRRTIFTNPDTRHDIFTVCDLLCQAYHKCAIASNIIGGFSGSGLWSREKNDVDPTKIRMGQFTSTSLSEESRSLLPTTRNTSSIVANSSDPEDQLTTYKELHRLFLSRAEQLMYDGVVEENGTISVSKTSGATLTSEKVLAALRERDQRKRERAQQQMRAQEERQKKAEEKQRLERQRLLDAEYERRYNTELRARRQIQQRVLSLTRTDRRRQAKRKFSDVSVSLPVTEHSQRRKV